MITDIGNESNNPNKPRADGKLIAAQKKEHCRKKQQKKHEDAKKARKKANGYRNIPSL